MCNSSTDSDPEALGFSRDRLSRIGDWAQGYISRGSLPGTLTLIVRDGKTAYVDARSYRDVEAQKPIAADSILRFYSMTKPITVVAALCLREAGMLDLDDSVVDYVPELEDLRVYVSGEGAGMTTEPLARPITVRHLLTHTAGFTYGFMDDSPVTRLYRDLELDFDPDTSSLAETVGRLASVPLIHQPGAAWNYSVGLDVMGHVIETVTGQILGDVFAERIFTPLGMVDSGFRVPEGKLDRFAVEYEWDGGTGMRVSDGPRQSPYVHGVRQCSGGGGLLSTAADYLRFAEMLRQRGAYGNARVLSPESLDLMTDNHLSGGLEAMALSSYSEMPYEGFGFGLGVAVMLDPSRANFRGTIGDFGWGGAASTYFWVDPVHDMTVLFVTQLVPSTTYPLREELRALVYDGLID